MMGVGFLIVALLVLVLVSRPDARQHEPRERHISKHTKKEASKAPSTKKTHRSKSPSATHKPTAGIDTGERRLKKKSSGRKPARKDQDAASLWRRELQETTRRPSRRPTRRSRRPSPEPTRRRKRPTPLPSGIPTPVPSSSSPSAKPTRRSRRPSPRPSPRPTRRNQGLCRSMPSTPSPSVTRPTYRPHTQPPYIAAIKDFLNRVTNNQTARQTLSETPSPMPNSTAIPASDDYVPEAAPNDTTTDGTA